MKSREADFKSRLQTTEREIMDSFKFTKKIADGKAASSSLSEAMSLKGEHIVLQWTTEYQGKDLSQMSR